MADHSPEHRDAPTLGYASAATRRAQSWLPDPLRRWWLSPPRVWQLILLALVLAFFARAATYPGPGHGSMACFLTLVLWPAALLVAFGGLVLGFDYTVRLIAALAARRMRARDPRWYLGLLLILGTIWTWNTDWLLRWRFAMNRPALEAKVGQLLRVATTAPADPDRDVQCPYFSVEWASEKLGDYRLVETAVFPDEGVVALTIGGFFRSGWGFLYDPNAVVRGPCKGLSLGGGWYTYDYAKE